MASAPLASLFVILLLSYRSAAWSDTFNRRVERGRARLGNIVQAVMAEQDINSPSTEPSPPCGIEKFDLVGDLQTIPEGLREIEFAAEDSDIWDISTEFYEISAIWPKSAGDQETTAWFQNGYYPPAGAMILGYNELLKDAEDNPVGRPPQSYADVCWECYKWVAKQVYDKPDFGLKEVDQIRWLIHTRIVTADGKEVFSEIWAATAEDEIVDGNRIVFDIDASCLGQDEVLAVLGLENASLESGLLRYHNSEMGWKMFYALTIYRGQKIKKPEGSKAAEEYIWYTWWEIRPARSQEIQDAYHAGNTIQSNSLNPRVNCFNGQFLEAPARKRAIRRHMSDWQSHQIYPLLPDS